MRTQILEQFESIRKELVSLSLFDEGSLIMIRKDSEKTIFDQDGNEVFSSLFEQIEEPFAVFTSGKYTRMYSEKGISLKASCDDMAQMFGYEVRCISVPQKNGRAFLIRDQGMLVTGRYRKELIAAAILAEKMCRTEILAEKTGRIHYLHPLLCRIEHLVYMNSYSKTEKEAEHG